MLHQLGKDQTSENMVGPQPYLALNHRVLILRGTVDPRRNDINGPNGVQDAMLSMAAEEPDQPIWLLVDSGGGDVATGMTLCDQMCDLPTPIYTVGLFAASMGAVILAAGDKRYVTKHAKTMIHLPRGQFEGDNNAVEIQKKEFDKTRDMIVDFLVEHGAKKTARAIKGDIDKGDHWMNYQETIDYGLADYLVTPDTYRVIFGSQV